MKLIIAGTYNQYMSYLQETKQIPKEAKYCCRLEHIFGYHNVEVVRYGEWWLNPLYNNDHLKAIEQEWVRGHK